MKRLTERSPEQEAFLKEPQPMTDRIAVLLAMADCRHDPVAMATCDLFLTICKTDNVRVFADVSLPNADKN